MKEINLILPSREMEEAANEFKNSFFEEGEMCINGSALFDQLEFPQWLEITEDNRNPQKVRADWVQSTTFFAVRESDNKIVGIVDIRHNLNNRFLSEYGGHIGYAVVPGERHKGIAVQMLNKAKEFAKSIGLDEVKLACYDTNEASIKTIEKCGGEFIECKPYLDDKIVNIYKITLE